MLTEYLLEREGYAVNLGADTAEFVVGDGARLEDLLDFGQHRLELVEGVGVDAGHTRHLHLIGLLHLLRMNCAVQGS